jgi:hypothetical protein
MVSKMCGHNFLLVELYHQVYTDYKRMVFLTYLYKKDTPLKIFPDRLFGHIILTTL